jgi:SAM-dependent methyltransferase
MVNDAWKKLGSLARKNLHRFQAKRAVRQGLFGGIDLAAMRILRQQYDGHGWQKYQDRFEHSLIRNAERVFRLGLQRSPPLRILDLGCGFGYFLYGAKQFGHQTVGLDVADPYLAAVTQLLGLAKVEHRIEPFQPLPEIPGGPFDLVTAFATVFDHAGHDGQWGVAEWRFLLQDLQRSMAPRCLLNVKFNQYNGPGTSPDSGRRPVPTELWEFFHSLGAEFDKRAMQIRDAPARIATISASSLACRRRARSPMEDDSGDVHQL